MTPTEAAAHKWLTDQGHAITQIGGNENPDFCTADGGRWEVKRLRKNVAAFTRRQFAEYGQSAPTTVLFWRDGESEPVAIANFADLPMNGFWEGIQIYVWADPYRRYRLAKLEPIQPPEMVA